MTYQWTDTSFFYGMSHIGTNLHGQTNKQKDRQINYSPSLKPQDKCLENKTYSNSVPCHVKPISSIRVDTCTENHKNIDLLQDSEP